jgi:Phosphotransferase enzyme family
MPVAAGTRITWSDLPAHVQAAVQNLLGDTVVSHASQVGGFSPGTADRVVTSTGRRAFVKAVSAAQNARTPDIHRSEAAIAARLPVTEHAPRLMGAFDDGEWVALVLEDVDGRHPRTPYDPAELDMVLASLSALTASLTPTPIKDVPRASEVLANDFAGWSRLAADIPGDLDPWAVARLDGLIAAAERGLRSLQHGESLAHTDLRADNLLIRSDGTVAFVDWPWACIGPAWLDMLLLLVNVNANGGHDMEALAHRYLPDVPEETVTAVLVALAGYFLDASRKPAQAGLPTLRAFQRHGGDTTLAWVKERMS